MSATRTFWAWSWGELRAHRFARKVDRDTWVNDDSRLDARTPLAWNDLSWNEFNDYEWHDAGASQ